MTSPFRSLLTVAATLAVTVAATAAEPAKTPSTDDILAKYVEASGGKAALEKLKSRVMRGEIEVASLGVNGPFEARAKAPDLQVTKIDFGGFGSMREGHDGKVAWSKAPGLGVRTKSPAELARVQRSTLFPRELKLAKGYSKLESKGASRVEGRETWHIEATPKDGKPDHLYFDQKTGLLLREETTTDSPAGPMLFQIDFDDYREVDGVKVAYLMRVPKPAEIGFRIKFTEVKHNVDLADSEFSPPKD